MRWQKPTANKVASMFGGTRDKCLGCNNTVYPTEKVTTTHTSSFLPLISLTERANPTSVNGFCFKVTVNGTPYHKSCFKCCHGGCTISPSNYIAHEGRLYCKHHHIQLIKEKGNLSQLEGDHEKIPAREKINGGEVASEAWSAESSSLPAVRICFPLHQTRYNILLCNPCLFKAMH